MLRRLFTFFSLSIMCLPTLAKADNVAVALVMPKAGSYQQQGAELTKGVQRAIDEINESGGLLGKKLELLAIDDQCSDGIGNRSLLRQLF